MMKNVVKLLIVLGAMIFGGYFLVSANNYNKLYVEKSSGESYLTGKYFCDYKIDVKVQGPYKYSTCKYYLKYNSGNETLSYVSTPTNVWGTIQETGYYSLNVGGLNFDVVRGSVGRGTNTQGVNICQNLNIRGMTTGQTQTILEFIDTKGNTSLTYDCDNKSRHMEVVGAVGDNTCNTLDLVEGLTIPYEACPCTIDGDAPVIYLTGTSSKFEGSGANKRITGINNFSVLVYDYSGNKQRDYWFNGSVTKNNTTYVKIDTANYFLDNQEGVEESSLKVTINYFDSAYGGRSDDVFSGSDLSPAAYTGTLKNGSKSITEKTWDGNDRGYWINFTNTSGFLVEKPVKIKIEANDNNFSLGSICKKTSKKSLSKEYTINQATTPTIKWLNISSGDTSVNPNLTVSMKISDDWAGIDTGSLIVRVTYPEWSGEVDSEIGERIMKTSEYSGDFFTGSMFVLSGGAEGLGNSGGYVVTFDLTDLPTETGIILSGYVKDLADNSTGSQITFYTRKPCSDFGCRDSFTITGVYEREGFGKPSSFGILPLIIVVEGSDYVEITGEYNDLLMCGPEVVPAYLTGNIVIFNENGETGAVNITDLRDGNIYFSGLDVEYDADNNYINIID